MFVFLSCHFNVLCSLPRCSGMANKICHGIAVAQLTVFPDTCISHANRNLAEVLRIELKYVEQLNGRGVLVKPVHVFT
ncbi:hypothetical protein GGS21DRAFT_519825 [Xylaria nigripes]|nr:hypothetical protein GGS21DRAFT_519825 [Xylaria nigripes]